MERFEPIDGLGTGAGVFVTPSHDFGADALALAAFARVGERVCELGTGCGIISVLLCRDAAARGAAIPHITAVDIQPSAVALAARSVAACGLEKTISVQQADWRTLTQNGVFDTVVCNPPYFPQNSGKLCPDAARRVARQEDSPHAFADLCEAAARLLKNGGKFFLCHRPERLCDVMCELRRAGLEPKRLRFLQNEGAAPWLFLCEARRGGHPGLTIE